MERERGEGVAVSGRGAVDEWQKNGRGVVEERQKGERREREGREKI